MKHNYYKELPDIYLKQVLNYEGGYVNDPQDSGGETCRGVTIGTLNNAKKQGLIASTVTIKSLLTDLESVRKIYDINYYQANKCNEMPSPLSFSVFDASVNNGKGGAGKMLQRSLNTLGEDLKVDGSIGPKTILAMKKCLETKTPLEITKIFNDFREKYFLDIVKNKPSQKKFINGWLNRLNSVRKFCENE